MNFGSGPNFDPLIYSKVQFLQSRTVGADYVAETIYGREKKKILASNLIIAKTLKKS